MSRYIDADLLFQTLRKNRIPYNADVNYYIQNAPTADVQEVRRGKWNVNRNKRCCSICCFAYYSNKKKCRIFVNI